MATRPRRPALGDVVLVASFLAFICLPLADGLLGLERPPRVVENRMPAPPPRLALTWPAVAELPRELEAYWNDRFGFRRTLIRLHGLASVWLGVSPSEKVVFGKSRWLFLGDEVPWRNPHDRSPLADAQLVRWQRELEARRDWLAARSAHYLFVVVPNKATIYPEYLPDALAPPAAPSDLHRLMVHLSARSTVDVLDLREALRQAKTRELVYHPADTHWNDRGVHTAYAAIIDRLARRFPGLTAVPSSASETLPRRRRSGDLADMVGLREHFVHEATPLRPRDPPRARPSATSVGGSPGRRAPFASEHPDAARPRALVFLDSFGLSLAPYLSEHFGRAVYVARPGFDPVAVLQERPDVVIHEVVERLLKWNLQPSDLPATPPPPRPR